MHHAKKPKQPGATTDRTDKLKIRDFRNMIIHAFEERLRFAVDKREPGHVPLQDRIPLGEDVIESIRKGGEFTSGPYLYKMQMAAMSMDPAQLLEMANAVPEALGRDRVATQVELHHSKPPVYQWMVHLTTSQKPLTPGLAVARVTPLGAAPSPRAASTHQSAAADSSHMRVA